MRISAILFLAAFVVFVLAVFEVDVKHLVEIGLALVALGLVSAYGFDRSLP